MKQYLFCRELYPGSEIVNKRSFRAFDTRDKSALLAVICPIQTAVSAFARDKSVYFWRKDCFECLSPRKNAA